MDPTQFTDPDDEWNEATEMNQAEPDAGDDTIDAVQNSEFARDAREIFDAAVPDESLEVAANETETSLPDAADSEAFPDTLPLLDETGNLPADIDSLGRSLQRWESMAAEFQDDPHFARKLTDKPRNELIIIERGMRVPVVFFDRTTMQPVSYKSENDSTSALYLPPRDEDERVETDLNAGRFRTPLVVTMARAPQHFQDAFEACAEKWIRLMTAICNDRISDYQHHQYSLDRAIHGQF